MEAAETSEEAGALGVNDRRALGKLRFHYRIDIQDRNPFATL